MTESWAKWLIFVAPPILLMAIGLTICVAEDDIDVFFKFFLPAGSLGFVLIYGISWVLLRWMTGGTYQAFQVMSERRGGTVERNIVGEQQLRIPHAEGTIAVDLRSTAESHRQARSGDSDRWTRIALECPGRRLVPCEWEFDIDDESARPDDLEATSGQLFEALRRCWPGGMKIKSVSEPTSASVEIWFSGWFQTVEVLTELLDAATPVLVELIAELESVSSE